MATTKKTAAKAAKSKSTEVDRVALKKIHDALDHSDTILVMAKTEEGLHLMLHGDSDDLSTALGFLSTKHEGLGHVLRGSMVKSTVSGLAQRLEATIKSLPDFARRNASTTKKASSKTKPVPTKVVGTNKSKIKK